jgi:cbb3-type cytochrome oxidase subunit 3
LLNITQQIASSIGVAVMSVILTNGLKNVKPGDLADAAKAFAHTYWVAFALVLVTVVAAVFLPRKREESHLTDEEPADPVPVIVH